MANSTRCSKTPENQRLGETGIKGSHPPHSIGILELTGRGEVDDE